MALTKTPIELSSTQGIVDNSNATAITIDSSENVGIGLTSPDAPLSVYSPSASANIKLTRAGTSEYLQLGTYYINSTNNDLQLATTTSHPMVFKTNNTERMRIDSSGNLLVGKTSTSSGVVGHRFNPDGSQESTTNGGLVAYFNRKTSDGEIVRFDKDGAAVGSIGTLDGNSIYIGNGDVNLRMIDVTDDIRPVTSTGTNRDAAIDLGDANARFKDLYLSGTATMGGLTVDTTTPFMSFRESGATKLFIGESSAVGGGAGYYDFYAVTGLGHRFFTNSVERMRINSNGTIAVNSTATNRELTIAAVLSNGQCDLALRASDDNNYCQLLFGDTSQDNQGIVGYKNGDEFMFFNTNGGERIRIDSSGNVGIGNSSPVELLTIGSTSNTNVRVQFLSSTSGANTIQFGDGTGAGAYAGYINYTHSDNALAFATGSTERLRIDSSGNVGIGTSFPDAKLTINAPAPDLTLKRNGTTEFRMGVSNVTNGGITGSFAGDTFLRSRNDRILFSTNDGVTAHAVIDGSGNLLVGTTNVSGSASEGIKFRASSNAKTISTVSTRSTSADEGITMWSTGANTWRFYVGWGGKINATSNTIQAISDQRFKENIRDLDDGLSKVMELRPRKFDWKEGKGADIKDDRGFIAQEFEEVFPDLVGEWKDEAPEGEEPYKAVSQDLIPTLVKAIQEQQTLIESLTARIAALEE